MSNATNPIKIFSAAGYAAIVSVIAHSWLTGNLLRMKWDTTRTLGSDTFKSDYTIAVGVLAFVCYLWPKTGLGIVVGILTVLLLTYRFTGLSPLEYTFILPMLLILAVGVLVSLLTELKVPAKMAPYRAH